ncbi:chorismate mutase [Fredinandcohnia quinoae]|uniref:chorismate mutase n=1 Tax=Fredinandcohnia quinoae TaxID=2918902 RepID=A0AAW5E3U0_9BACI|nr:chorismate mutase [Fredinandcohnia sp. SECRCQ15]MCH1624747.1 chorismate mutase [Fredinandcohnia sp. SECRCQ15]
MVRGVRGATTIEDNTKQEIISATEKLLREMIDANNIKATDVAQILVSTTDDINACFPAAAVRLLEGWTFVPVMCMKEIPVPDSLPLCIRVMMTVNTEVEQSDITHIYLEKAILLRPDLTKHIDS